MLLVSFFGFQENSEAPPLAARHSQHARAHTEIFPKKIFFH